MNLYRTIFLYVLKLRALMQEGHWLGDSILKWNLEGFWGEWPDLEWFQKSGPGNQKPKVMVAVAVKVYMVCDAECDRFRSVARRPCTLLHIVQVDHRWRPDRCCPADCYCSVLAWGSTRSYTRAGLQHTGPLSRPAQTLSWIAIHLR